MGSLLPCPFCGGEVSNLTIQDEEYYQDEFGYHGTIVCSSCSLCMHDYGDTLKEAESNTIDSWNTRYQPTCKLIHEEREPHIHIGKWTCSECGGWAMLPPYDLSDATFCPHCGRKVIEVVR